jgi:uncharacterized membrane protein
LISIGIIGFDLFIYLILLAQMIQYDDFYDESKGKYWSFESMTRLEKISSVTLTVWNLLNLIVGLYIIFRFIRQFIISKRINSKDVC